MNSATGCTKDKAMSHVIVSPVLQVVAELVLSDLNDNPPVFHPPSSGTGIPPSEKYIMSIMENSETMRNIGIINVTDADKGDNGEGRERERL